MVKCVISDRSGSNSSRETEKKKKRKVALQKEAEIASNHEDLRKIEKKTLI